MKGAPWDERLRAEGVPLHLPEFSLVTHTSIAPAFPPEYDVPGLVAVTFRRGARPDGALWYATAIDVAAAFRLGVRLGLTEAEALAMVDSHERIHVWLQLAGVDEDVEEHRMRIVDAVWLSLHHPRAAERVATGEFGLVTHVHDDFWEALVDERQARERGGRDGSSSRQPT